MELITLILSLISKLTSIVADAIINRNKTSAEIQADLDTAWSELTAARLALRDKLSANDKIIDDQIAAMKAKTDPPTS